MKFVLGLVILTLTLHAGATGMLILRATVPGSYDVLVGTRGDVHLQSNIPSHLPQPRIKSFRRGNLIFVSIIHP